MNKIEPSAVIEPKIRPVRRVVTGFDANGRSTILLDAPAAQVLAIGASNHGTTELWSTATSPPSNDGPLQDPCVGRVTLAPAKGGSVFRVVEFPPDREYLPMADRRAVTDLLGDPSDARAPMMHASATLDYAVVLQGEIWAVLDDAEVRLEAGDTLIQRGTNHGWSNRSDRCALVAFVLLGAQPLPG